MPILAYLYDSDEEEHPHTEALRAILKTPDLPKPVAALCRKALKAEPDLLGKPPHQRPPAPGSPGAGAAVWVDAVLGRIADSYDPEDCPTQDGLMEDLLVSAMHWCDANGELFYERLWVAQDDYTNSLQDQTSN